VNSGQIDRIRASFALLTPRMQELVDRFHARLLVQQPDVRPVLSRDFTAIKQDLAAALRMVVKNLNRLEAIDASLLDMGARQARVGLTPRHYGVGREVLLTTMREMAGPAWTDQLTADWTEAMNAVVSILIVGGARARSAAA
jgi:hemoglobin-like flavoprotein